MVHQQGIVGTGKWVPNKAALADNGYTGLFRSGSDSVLIRFSDDFHVDGITTAVNPSLAMKFLRDGMPSGNQFGMVSFEGDPDEEEPWNWFAYDLSNHLPQFEANEENTCASGRLDRSQVYDGECGPQTAAKWNSQVTGFIFQNGSADMAQYDQTGKEAQNPYFPFQLKFVPSADLTPTNGDSRFYKQLVDGGPAEIGDDVLLYTVYGKNTPRANEEWIEVAELYSTSKFYQSLWGDERLFFRHRGLEADLAYYEDAFRASTPFVNNVPYYNFDKYGEWDNPSTFEDWEATADDIVNGMATTGCPFAFLIDQINALGPNV